ncbi:acyltransferase family protein [Hymenobacter frigidus]|uniref:acyltransferase family protein n=1 Tax=Hymenobacter frigidus TaxID=1524095 RepID=UPI00166E28B3|nr:acyltransferase [Hymenobacter frigidus]
MLTIPSPSQAKMRLPGLDYLRGLAALGIMTYHYCSWTFGEQPANSFLGRVGIYGVAIFYILSGQTLSYIYSSSLHLKIIDLREFYKRRFFRIFPLLWLATLLSIALSKHVPAATDVFLNLTGLFGLVKWDVYFATGAWSIGNELCFYLAFPLLVFLLNKSRIVFFLFALLALVITCYFSFVALKTNATLSDQWHIYTNPLNQFVLFLGGVLMGKFIQSSAVRLVQSALIGAIGFAIFLLLPIQGAAIVLVTGFNRLFFIVSCLLLCYSFFSSVHASVFIDKPLLLLGQISYSVYLLHPLVYAIIKACFSLIARVIPVPNIYTLLTSIIVSLVASYLSYTYFERFFIGISHNSKSSGFVG